jgi:uncharacterized protein (DUF1778 family)
MTNSINIRITKAEKKRLQEIAAIAGLSLSALLRSAAVAEAYRVLGPPKLVSDGQYVTKA